MPQAPWSILLVAAALLGVAPACSDAGDTQSAAPQPADDSGQPLPAGSVDCSSDPRLDDEVGVATMGELGLLSFRLVQLAPSPPARGTNTFQLHIEDRSGAPMVGELRVISRMPDHGHGSSVQPRVLGGEGGDYSIEQLVFFMAGVWRVELEVRVDGAALDRKSFFFCVQG